MNNEDVAVFLARHDEEIGSLKHRVDDLEDLTKSINDLAINIKELAINVSTTNASMACYETRLQRQGERIGELEKQPADKYNAITTTLITAVISAIVTFIFATLL